MSNSGFDDSFGRAAIDSPMIKANIKMLSICPSRYEVIGFFGIMLDIAFGMSSKEKPSLIFISLLDRSYDSCSAEISRRLPGAINDARNTATSIAIVVVITKYDATPNPRVFSFSVVPSELIATTMEEKINGTMIM